MIKQNVVDQGQSAYTYDLFRRGFDTLEIANMMRIQEPEVVKRIDAERKKRDQFKASYPKAQPKKRKRLIMFNEFGRPVYE